MDRIEIAQSFSDISRNSGRTAFKVTYTATEGNLEIDKEFQEFCFKYANNEYLQGIKLLLQYFKHYKELYALNDYVAVIDARLTDVEDKLSGKTEEPERKEKKTF